MPALPITVDLEATGAWRDLDGKTVIRCEDLAIGGVPRGMLSGAPSVMLRLNLPDGTVVIAETSLALLLTAADALRGGLGDPRR